MREEWLGLSRDVKRRLQAIVDPPRLMYFVVVVIGIGGLGAWLSETAQFNASLASYAMGIAAAAAVELVLPDSSSRSMRMLAISLGSASISMSIMATTTRTSSPGGLEPGHLLWPAAAFAWLLWILSASTNANIGSPNPAAATGGDTQSLSGDTTGFQT